MRFIYGRHDFQSFERGEENCWLMTNGLGGFSSLTVLGSCSRGDHAVLMSCEREEAPNRRWNMIHRLEEVLTVGEKTIPLSSQAFSGGHRLEEGFHNLIRFVYEDYPRWCYLAEGVEIEKEIVLRPESNTVGILYRMSNHSDKDVTFEVKPWLLFAPKGEKPDRDQQFYTEETAGRAGGRCSGVITSNGRKLYYSTDGRFNGLPLTYCSDLYYAYDACDGRPAEGCCAANHSVTFQVQAGGTVEGELVYGTEGPVQVTAVQIREELAERRRRLKEQSGFRDETAQALALAADQFISYRASTGKQTILAGYPFFEDWGRDTMIALPGCCLATGQYDTAKNILRTFMQYCQKGLMPNLFPEGGKEPRYNTADAALLFILAVYGYYVRTEDREFAAECYPVMEEIVRFYEEGTDFSISMDEDGLIRAGSGFDQVTWMDVRVGDILPTPRHGKPVEINAYWYNALCIMDFFQKELGETNARKKKDYRSMGERTRKSFQKQFWNENAGCLKDVISGTGADEQIRCNQIWAVSQPFSVLEEWQEKQVVETVFRRLYTPLGLRTLDPDDDDFRPCYGGELLERDLAYHQGTVWTYPLGGYYLAYLKVCGYSEAAVKRVRLQLESITAALREGCIGQLPEIYDGLEPVFSKGCFAQAWSVGELLRVYEALERTESFQKSHMHEKSADCSAESR